MAWISGRQLVHRRYEGKASPFLAVASIARTLIRYRRLTRPHDIQDASA